MENRTSDEEVEVDWNHPETVVSALWEGVKETTRSPISSIATLTYHLLIAGSFFVLLFLVTADATYCSYDTPQMEWRDGFFRPPATYEREWVPMVEWRKQALKNKDIFDTEIRHRGATCAMNVGLYLRERGLA